MIVGFATSDWSTIETEMSLGGAGHYRCGLPAEALRRLGFEVYLGRLMFARRQGVFGVADWNNQIKFPDVLVMQRWMHAALDMDVFRARSEGQLIWNDVDDWFFGLPTSNRAFMATHPGVSPLANVNHYRLTIAASNGVTVSTPYLAERLAGHLPRRPVVIRNGIDVDRWAPRTDEAESSPVIGWVGATAWRSGDLETLKGILGPFLERHDLKFHHGGAMAGTQAWEQLGVAAERCSAAPMHPITTYPSLFEPIDVGLVPLRDTPFNSAKSCIKGMEYAAAGVPFVAFDTPEYRWLVREKGIGRLASRPRDWTRHLTELLDPEVRRTEAAENRKRVEALTVDGEIWVTALGLDAEVPVTSLR